VGHPLARDILLRKNDFPPIWTACTTFFQRRYSRFESQIRTKNTIYTIYIQPKKTVQIIGILEEIEPIL